MNEVVAPSRLRRWWMIVFGTVFVALIAWRWSILDSPPYWDSVYGLWMEAEFLERTDFDYRRLRYEEKHGTVGGAYSYMTSVLPTLVAIAFRYAPSDRSVIVGYHLFNIACAAAVAATVWVVLYPRTCGLGASLCVAALLSTPVFSAQVDMLGMEFPTTLGALTAALLVWRRWWILAAAASLATFFLKATGMLVTLVSLAFLLIRLWGRRRWRGPIDRGIRHGVAAHFAVLFVEILVLYWGGTTAHHLAIRNRPDVAGPASAFIWFPELVCLYALVLMGGAVRLTSHKIPVHHGLGGLCRRLSGEPILLLCLLLVVTVIAATMRVVLIPRYIIITLPFFYIAFGCLLFESTAHRKVGSLILSAIIGMNLANQYGRFYPSIAATLGPQYARTGAMLERSREYLADHLSNQAAVRRIEEDCADEPIFAGHPFVYVLTIPRMGYVSRPLQGYALNEFSQSFPSFVDVTEASVASFPKDPVFVAVANTYYYRSILFTIPERTRRDQVIYDDEFASPLVVFRKRWGDREQFALGRSSWYLNRFLPWASPEVRATTIANRLIEEHLQVAGTQTLTTGLDAYRPSGSSATELVEELWFRGERAEAVAAYAESLESKTSPEAAWKQISTTLNFLDRTADLQSSGLGPLAEGVVELRSGALTTAEERLRHCVSSGVAKSESQRFLGVAYLQQGRWDDAASSFKRVLEIQSESAHAHHGLGLVLARQGRWQSAVEAFESALRIAPGWSSAQRDLGTAESRLKRKDSLAAPKEAR